MARQPAFRQQVRREALLFNSNSLYDLLKNLALVEGDFHAPRLAAQGATPAPRPRPTWPSYGRWASLTASALTAASNGFT